MSRHATILILAIIGLAAARARAADEVKFVEENGITYRETTQTIRRPLPETKLESQEVTVYREQLSTELKQIDRTYQIPITEYQWVPGWQRSWNPFAAPVLTYRLMQVTRYETRTEPVKIPVTTRKVVPEKLTQQVPVTTQRIVEDRFISRVAVGTKPAGDPFASTARRQEPASPIKLDGDPPRDNSTWRPADSGTRR